MSTGVDDKMYKELTAQPRNVVQVYSVRVKAVGGMSTDVDRILWNINGRVEAVSEMSTSVDCMSEMSTNVDIISLILAITIKIVNRMSTGVNMEINIYRTT